ncbi:MAG: hypothetical protein KatS3mg014_1598 [Actinomycetota bacterium]|nr:MAG: hypothetical protein KatS3mg014_1598 [Actinomycetota bacterium]
MRTEPATATFEAFAEEVRRLARERDAVILAHNYQDAVRSSMDVADVVGDSLAARAARQRRPTSEASTIVFSAASTSWPRPRSCSIPTRPC